MLQVYVSNVSPASDLCYIQVFHVASVSCFRGMFKVMGARSGTGERGAASQGLADGAHGVPRVLRTGRAHTHPSSRFLPAWREEGVRGRNGGHSWRVRAGGGEVDGSGAR